MMIKINEFLILNFNAIAVVAMVLQCCAITIIIILSFSFLILKIFEGFLRDYGKLQISFCLCYGIQMYKWL